MSQRSRITNISKPDFLFVTRSIQFLQFLCNATWIIVNVGQQQRNSVHTEGLIFNHYGQSNGYVRNHCNFPPKTSITLHGYRKAQHTAATVSENRPNPVTPSPINYFLRGSGSIGQVVCMCSSLTGWPLYRTAGLHHRDPEHSRLETLHSWASWSGPFPRGWIYSSPKEIYRETQSHLTSLSSSINTRNSAAYSFKLIHLNSRYWLILNTNVFFSSL